MKYLNIRYYKPRTKKVKTSIVDNELYVSKQTIMLEQHRKKIKVLVPVMSKIHPETFLMLSKVAASERFVALVPIALYFAAALTKENSFEVEVQAKHIENDLGFSDKSITKALNMLENFKLITQDSRGKYLVSPKLAFYGDPEDWSIAMEHEQEGETFVYNKIAELKANREKLSATHNEVK